MDIPAVLDRLVALEAEVTYREPPANGEPPFRYEPGRLPVLISAPHGASHRRNGRYKPEDEYTAAFARLLAERTGAHVLYTCACSDNDPNWDFESPYKITLGRMVAKHGIRFVADIHGMSDRHKFGIAVGTMCGASCRHQHEAFIVATLKAAQFAEVTAREAQEYPGLRWDQFVVNHGRFTGGLTSHTVTRYAVEELGIHAAQFELCTRLRVVRRQGTARRPAETRGDPAGIVQALSAFERLVLGLAQ